MIITGMSLFVIQPNAAVFAAREKIKSVLKNLFFSNEKVLHEPRTVSVWCDAFFYDL